MALVLISAGLAAFVFVDAQLVGDIAKAPAVPAPANVVARQAPAAPHRRLEALQQASLAAFEDAKAQYLAAGEALDVAWRDVEPDRAKALADNERDWKAQTKAACKQTAANLAPGHTAQEAARLRCEANARQARTAWLQAPPDQVVATTAPVETKPTPPAPAELGSSTPARTTLVSTPPQPVGAKPSPQPAVLSPREACDFIRTPKRRTAEPVSFRAEYMSDHRGLMLIRPVGCDQGAGVEAIEPAALRRIARADPPPWSFPSRRLVAEVTARLVRGDQDGDLDGGGAPRLSISDVRSVRAVQPPPAPPSPRLTRPPTPRQDCTLCSDDVAF